MRYKRVNRFKKIRRRKARKMILLTVVMPSMLILLGYLVASIIILPYMSG